MKLESVLPLFALAALALLWVPSVTASSPAASGLKAPSVQRSAMAQLPQAAAAPSCSTALTFAEPPIFTLEARSNGCSSSQCDKSCRLQGYDYGVCFADTCICRFWFP